MSFFISLYNLTTKVLIDVESLSGKILGVVYAVSIERRRLSTGFRNGECFHRVQNVSRVSLVKKEFISNSVGNNVPRVDRAWSGHQSGQNYISSKNVSNSVLSKLLNNRIFGGCHVVVDSCTSLEWDRVLHRYTINGLVIELKSSVLMVSDVISTRNVWESKFGEGVEVHLLENSPLWANLHGWETLLRAISSKPTTLTTLPLTGVSSATLPHLESTLLLFGDTSLHSHVGSLVSHLTLLHLLLHQLTKMHLTDTEVALWVASHWLGRINKLEVVLIHSVNVIKLATGVSSRTIDTFVVSESLMWRKLHFDQINYLSFPLL